MHSRFWWPPQGKPGPRERMNNAESPLPPLVVVAWVACRRIIVCFLRVIFCRQFLPTSTMFSCATRVTVIEWSESRTNRSPAFRMSKFSGHDGKKSFYSAFNAVFGQVAGAASEEVAVELLKVKRLLVLLYGFETCPISNKRNRSLDFALNGCFRKIFCTKSA